MNLKEALKVLGIKQVDLCEPLGQGPVFISRKVNGARGWTPSQILILHRVMQEKDPSIQCEFVLGLLARTMEERKAA